MPMRGFEKHRLTRSERTLVIGVAVVSAIILAVWILSFFLLLPEPSHGLV